VSERTWTVAAGITLAVVVALLAQRVVPRMNVAGKPDRGQWVLQDFRDAVYYPVHLNPRVQAPVRRILDRHPRIHLLPPVSYGALVDLLRHCHLVLTDSGGIQEEAPSLGKPVLVLRDTTERQGDRECVAGGAGGRLPGRSGEDKRLNPPPCDVNVVMADAAAGFASVLRPCAMANRA
jgi:UDP-N-acetylglucosamine 2-epimerase